MTTENLTDRQIEDRLATSSRHLTVPVDLEAILDRMEADLSPPRASRLQWRRLAVACLAFSVAGAGFVLATRLTRTQPRPPATPASEVVALWPEHDAATLAEAQGRADRGEDAWRLDPNETKVQFARQALEWDDAHLGCNRPYECPPAAVGFVSRRAGGPPLYVQVAQLGRSGNTGIWSVVRVGSGDQGLGAFELPPATGTALEDGVRIRAGQELWARSDLDSEANVSAAYVYRGPCGAEAFSPPIQKGGVFWTFDVGRGHPDGPSNICAERPETVPGVILLVQGSGSRPPDATRLGLEAFAGVTWNGLVFPHNVVRIAAIPVIFDFADPVDPSVLIYPRGAFASCPDLDDTLPVGPQFAPGAEEAAQDRSPKNWAVRSSGPASDDPLLVYGCGPEVAARTWTVVVYPLADPDSASLDIQLYLVRRPGGWEVWGSY